MTQAELLAKIDAAKKVIGDAEDELQRLEHGAGALPAEEEEVGEVVQVALSRVKAAEAALVDLERLLELAATEAAKIEAAKTAIIAAEEDLDRVLGEMQVPRPVQERWVTEIVADAFAKLRAAKRGLADLQRSIETDEG